MASGIRLSNAIEPATSTLAGPSELVDGCFVTVRPANSA
jgi:hypothetical protein